MFTSEMLVAFVQKAKKEKWGYVYGADGSMYTPALAEKWGKQKRAGKTLKYFMEDCAHWFGHRVVDCSELIVQAFRSVNPKYSDRNAATFRSQFVESGTLKTMPEIPGLAVWRSGHIGVYVGGGKVIEAGGYRVGVVETALSKPATGKAWTRWGKLQDVDYTLAQKPSTVYIVQKGDTLSNIAKGAGMTVAEIAEINGIKNPNLILPGQELKLVATGYVFTRALKKKSPTMKGDDVRELQKLLKKAGVDPGPIDGSFGPLTLAGVKAFQKSKKLDVDGSAGPKTIAALGGVWKS